MLTQTKTAEPITVSGINVDALLALIEGVKGDAAQGKTQWRVTSLWQGQTRSCRMSMASRSAERAYLANFAVDIDEPCELGGSNRFANPQEYLLAALNACMVVGYAAQCALRGITLEKAGNRDPW